MKLLLLLKKLETSKESVFKKIENIRTNHGTKFLMLSFMNFKGILHQHSCVEISQQNFVVQRKHQHHILNILRVLLFQSHLLLHFWGDVVLTATHFINRWKIL